MSVFIRVKCEDSTARVHAKRTHLLSFYQSSWYVLCVVAVNAFLMWRGSPLVIVSLLFTDMLSPMTAITSIIMYTVDSIIINATHLRIITPRFVSKGATIRILNGGGIFFNKYFYEKKNGWVK